MSRRLRLNLAAALAFIIIAAATHPIWLGWLGHALVAEQEPIQADAALVLGGDYSGSRIKRAAALVEQGYVPLVLVSGAVTMYGLNEADLAINYAVSQGLPRSIFEPVYMRATSTKGECEELRGKLQARDIRRLLLVTSSYHTARALRTCKGPLRGIEVRMVASPDRYFTPDAWWLHREGQKTLFFEYAKTIANWLGH